MILTIIHTILLVLCVAQLAYIYYTDYLRQKEQDELKALEYQIKQSGLIFDLLVLIVLTLIL